MNISIESPAQAEISALILALDDYQKPLYPAESHHGIDMKALAKNNVIFAVARDGSEKAIACGAMVIEGEAGELKRMYTVPAERGKGIARTLLGFLERSAVDRGCRRFFLETGNLQPEAVSLYIRCGYQICGPFGSYTDDKNSVFMQKNVASKT